MGVHRLSSAVPRLLLSSLGLGNCYIFVLDMKGFTSCSVPAKCYLVGFLLVDLLAFGVLLLSSSNVADAGFVIE